MIKFTRPFSLFTSHFYCMPSSPYISRILATLLFTSLFCLTAYAQQNTDAQIAGLKSSVHIVTEGWIDPPERGGKRQIINVRKYDQKGNEIEWTGYGGNPITRERSPILKVVFTFDKLVKTERSYRISEPSQSKGSSIPVIVAVNGKPVEPKPTPTPPALETDGSFLRQTIYKLDAQGNRSEEIWYEGRIQSSSILRRKTYQRNQQGLIETCLYFGKTGQQTSREERKYDDKGLVIEYLQYDAEKPIPSQNSYSNYELDAKGNWIKRTVKMSYLGGNGKTINSSQIEYREISYY